MSTNIMFKITLCMYLLCHQELQLIKLELMYTPSCMRNSRKMEVNYR